MNKLIRLFIEGARPKTIPASISPIIMGTALSYKVSHDLDPIIGALTLLCTIFLQIGTNLANDYYDFKKGADRADRQGPKRVTGSGEIKESLVKNSFITIFMIALLLGIYLMKVGGLPIIIIGLLSIFFAWAYTGGPYPLAYHGLGEIFALLFFGLIAVGGTYYLQTKTFSALSLIVGSAPGFISFAILAINNLRDIESDRISNKRTLAVRFGIKFARFIPLFGISYSFIAPIIFSYFFSLKFLFLMILPIIFIKNWNRILTGPIDRGLNETLATTGKYLLLYSILFSVLLFL